MHEITPVLQDSPHPEDAATTGQVFRRASLIFGTLSASIGVMGVIGLVTGNTFLRSIVPGYQTMAFSTAVLCILFGSVLAARSAGLLRGGIPSFLAGIFAAIAIIEALELPLNITGVHLPVETLLMSAGTAIAHQPTSPISPGTLVIVIIASVAAFTLLVDRRSPDQADKKNHDAAGLAGLVTTLLAGTFLLSYVFGAPFLYGTRLVPIAAPTAIALTFVGAGLVTAAGATAFPLRYFTGSSTSARLLRIFLPLTLAIIIGESIIHAVLESLGPGHDALQVSISIAVFSLITGFVVIRVSRSLGKALDAAERGRKEAESGLLRKNKDLTAANEELRAMGEKMKGQFDELSLRERELEESEIKYRSLFENMLEGFAYCRMFYDEKGSPADFSYLVVNQAFDRIVGTKTVTGRRVTEIFPGIRDAFPGLFEIYGRVALTGRAESFDLDFKPLGKWLHISVYSMEKEHFVAIFEDITLRKKAEEALRLYQVFTENARDIILFINPADGRILEANKAAERTYGYSREELLGMTIFDLRRPDARHKVDRPLNLASQGGILFETIHRTKDGRDLSVEVSTIAMNGEREPVIISIIRDISLRKRASELQALLASIVTHSTDAIIGYTTDGIITSWNAGAERIYGYSSGEAVGRTISFLIPEDYAGDPAYIFGKIRSDESLTAYETESVRKDGQRIQVSMSVSPIKDEDGKLVGSSAIVRDITEKKQLLGEILRAKEEWEMTFDSVPDLIAIIDRNYRISRVNRAMADKLGIPQESVAGRVCHDVVHHLGEPPGICPHSLLLADGKIHSVDVHEETLKSDFHVTVSPIYDAQGKVTGSVHVMHDITETRRAEDAIRIANKKLNMLSSITRHDILNQIMGLRTYLELSKELEQDPGSLRYIEKEIAAADAIGQQIEFTRFYQDIGVEVPEWHDLRKVIRGAAGQLNLEGITLELMDRDTEIFADPLVGKVFYNLMENSLRHGVHVTRIGFFLEETEAGATISYRDDGTGIALDDKPKLFTRGFGKHTGLGLFLSREILSITGITIVENGKPGEGVHFEITVPKNAYRIGSSAREQ